MSALTLAEMERFLAKHQAELVAVFLQAYDKAGGHYAVYSPEDRQRQARIDSQQYTEDLLLGRVDSENVWRTIINAANPAALADDIVHMSAAIDDLFADFVHRYAPDHLILAEELIRRSRNLTGSFRAAVTTARMDAQLRQFGQ
jgi:hypothetical protein